MFGLTKKETVYPCWRYHKEEAARVVNNEEEEKALGRGWKDRPYEDGEEPGEGLSPASADSDKAEPSEVLHPEDPEAGAKIKTELGQVDSKNKVIDKRTEDMLIKEIKDKGLSDLKTSTLKRKGKQELLDILEGNK